MRLKFNFLLTLCAIYNNQYNLAKPIIGSNVRSAEENELASVVSIMYMISSTDGHVQSFHGCTGTLISRQDVITAEHCLREVMITPIKIMIGSIDLDRSTAYFPLFCFTYDHWALHRHIQLLYSSNDIALVKLLRNVPESIQFALLGNAPSNVLYGLDVLTAGWGSLENNTMPRIMQKANLKILTHQECKSRISSYRTRGIQLHDRRLCTIADPYAVLNYGDSGGPLFFFDSLIAINSGVFPVLEGYVQPYQVNIHLGLRYYYNFIIDVTTTLRMNY